MNKEQLQAYVAEGRHKDEATEKLLFVLRPTQREFVSSRLEGKGVGESAEAAGISRVTHHGWSDAVWAIKEELEQRLIEDRVGFIKASYFKALNYLIKTVEDDGVQASIRSKNARYLVDRVLEAEETQTAADQQDPIEVLVSN